MSSNLPLSFTSGLSIQKAAQRYRWSLDQKIEPVARDLVREYARTSRALSERIGDLGEKIRLAELAGEEVTPAWLFQKKRLEQIESFVQREVSRIAAEAGVDLEKVLREAGLQGAIDGRDAALRSLGGTETARASVAGHWARPAIGPAIGIAGASVIGSPLGDLLAGLPGAAGLSIREALIRGVLTGIPVKRLASEIAGELGGNLSRALTIARTEAMRAYRLGHTESYKASGGIVEGWTWHARLDENCCPGCWTAHGSEHPPDELMESHPNCRCIPIPRTPSWEELGYPGLPDTRPQIEDAEAKFRALDPAMQRRIMGPKAAELFRAGQVGWEDLGTWRDAGRWGRNRAATSLRELQRIAGGGRLPPPPPPTLPPPVAPAPPMPGGEGFGAIKAKVSAAFDDALASVANSPLAARHPGYQAVAAKIREALGVIDRTFTDGALPKMPEIGPLTNVPAGVQGAYSHSAFAPIPVSLKFRPRTPIETVFHEMTHFIDHLGMGVKWGRGLFGSEIGFAASRGELGAMKKRILDRIAQERLLGPVIPGSQRAAELEAMERALARIDDVAALMGPVADAIRASSGYQGLLSARATGRIQYPKIGPGGIAEAFVPYSLPSGAVKWAGYAIAPEEVFARAMAQYLAKKAGPAAMRQIEEAVYMTVPHSKPPVFIRNSAGQRVVNPMADQWTWEDFAPIERAIEEMLGRAGWLL